jgi:biphenyl 2,3-dioxygenase beta subunit
MTTTAVDYQLQYEIEQFLYAEAALLDDRKMHEWLELFTEDTHYWMPIRRTRTVDQLDQEFSPPEGMAFFDDDRNLLEMRIKKLDTGYSWSEDPPSRTRHLITNVRIGDRDGAELTVYSNFMLYRTRLATDVDMWVGTRTDVLRQVDGHWKIAKRHIFLDQTTITSKNLSNFF